MDSIAQEFASLEERLTQYGFQRQTNSAYRRGNLAARVGPRWTTLAIDSSAALKRIAKGGPGLWKVVADTPDGDHRAEFQLPSAVLAPACSWDAARGVEVDPFKEVIAWARATAGGKIPPSWNPPPAEEVQVMVPPEVLAVQVGSQMRQGSVVQADRQFRLRIPILHAVPQKLDEPRRRWLQVMITHIQQRCLMARVIESESDDRFSVYVEIDLTGAPHCVLPELLQFGVDAARSVVSWFLLPMTVLADTAVSCSAWEVSPERIWSAD